MMRQKYRAPLQETALVGFSSDYLPAIMSVPGSCLCAIVLPEMRCSPIWNWIG